MIPLPGTRFEQILIEALNGIDVVNKYGDRGTLALDTIKKLGGPERVTSLYEKATNAVLDEGDFSVGKVFDVFSRRLLSRVQKTNPSSYKDLSAAIAAGRRQLPQATTRKLDSNTLSAMHVASRRHSVEEGYIDIHNLEDSRPIFSAIDEHLESIGAIDKQYDQYYRIARLNARQSRHSSAVERRLSELENAWLSKHQEIVDSATGIFGPDLAEMYDDARGYGQVIEESLNYLADDVLHKISAHATSLSSVRDEIDTLRHKVLFGKLSPKEKREVNKRISDLHRRREILQAQVRSGRDDLSSYESMLRGLWGDQLAPSDEAYDRGVANRIVSAQEKRGTLTPHEAVLRDSSGFNARRLGEREGSGWLGHLHDLDAKIDEVSPHERMINRIYARRAVMSNYGRGLILDPDLNQSFISTNGLIRGGEFRVTGLIHPGEQLLNTERLADDVAVRVRPVSFAGDQMMRDLYLHTPLTPDQMLGDIRQASARTVMGWSGQMLPGSPTIMRFGQLELPSGPVYSALQDVTYNSLSRNAFSGSQSYANEMMERSQESMNRLNTRIAHAIRNSVGESSTVSLDSLTPGLRGHLIQNLHPQYAAVKHELDVAIHTGNKAAEHIARLKLGSLTPSAVNAGDVASQLLAGITYGNTPYAIVKQLSSKNLHGRMWLSDRNKDKDLLTMLTNDKSEFSNQVLDILYTQLDINPSELVGLKKWQKNKIIKAAAKKWAKSTGIPEDAGAWTKHFIELQNSMQAEGRLFQDMVVPMQNVEEVMRGSMPLPPTPDIVSDLVRDHLSIEELSEYDSLVKRMKALKAQAIGGPSLENVPELHNEMREVAAKINRLHAQAESVQRGLEVTREAEDIAKLASFRFHNTDATVGVISRTLGINGNAAEMFRAHSLQALLSMGELPAEEAAAVRSILGRSYNPLFGNQGMVLERLRLLQEHANITGTYNLGMRIPGTGIDAGVRIADVRALGEAGRLPSSLQVTYELSPEEHLEAFKAFLRSRGGEFAKMTEDDITEEALRRMGATNRIVTEMNWVPLRSEMTNISAEVVSSRQVINRAYGVRRQLKMAQDEVHRLQRAGDRQGAYAAIGKLQDKYDRAYKALQDAGVSEASIEQILEGGKIDRIIQAVDDIPIKKVATTMRLNSEALSDLHGNMMIALEQGDLQLAGQWQRALEGHKDIVRGRLRKHGITEEGIEYLINGGDIEDFARRPILAKALDDLGYYVHGEPQSEMSEYLKFLRADNDVYQAAASGRPKSKSNVAEQARGIWDYMNRLLMEGRANKTTNNLNASILDANGNINRLIVPVSSNGVRNKQAMAGFQKVLDDLDAALKARGSSLEQLAALSKTFNERELSDLTTDAKHAVASVLSRNLIDKAEVSSNVNFGVRSPLSLGLNIFRPGASEETGGGTEHLGQILADLVNMQAAEGSTDPVAREMLRVLSESGGGNYGSNLDELADALHDYTQRMMTPEFFDAIPDTGQGRAIRDRLARMVRGSDGIPDDLDGLDELERAATEGNPIFQHWRDMTTRGARGTPGATENIAEEVFSEATSSQTGRQAFKAFAKTAWESKSIRYGTLGLAAAGAGAAVYHNRRNSSDHMTEESIAGPPNMPGGSPYGAPPTSMIQPYTNMNASNQQNGVTYIVNARGSADRQALMEQMSAMSNASVYGNIYDVPSPGNPDGSDDLNSIINSYS